MQACEGGRVCIHAGDVGETAGRQELAGKDGKLDWKLHEKDDGTKEEKGSDGGRSCRSQASR